MAGKIIRQSRFLKVMTFLVITGALLAALVLPASVSAQTDSPYPVRTFLDSDGRLVDEVIFSGRPPEVKAAVVSAPEPHIAAGINVLTDVPIFDWCYGCSATSAAMLFGYYDRIAYPEMYTGSTNYGICPLDNSTWDSGECPLSATHQGYDGLATRGHVDDYWIAYGSTDDDPFIGNWTEHTHADCTGDFMGTNQSSFNNTDGSTRFYFDSTGAPLDNYEAPSGYRDGCYGLRLFAESRGYTVTTNFSQYIFGRPGNDPGLGFTFSDFQAEIDAGRPVLIHVEGHTMLGYGYVTEDSTINIHDTWDHDKHEMTWGGTYPYNDTELQHFGVTIIELAASSHPTVTVAASDVAIYDGDAGVDAFTITTTFSETMDDSFVPTVVFTPALDSTLTNPSGGWSDGDTVYTWTYDIDDDGVKEDNVDVMVYGGRDPDGNAQAPGINTDYIDVDTQNPTVTIAASDVAIYDGDAGVDAFTITATFSEVMNNSIEYVPTVVFDPELDSTLTNPSGAWSDGDTVYTWTYDINDDGVKEDNVDVTVDGGRDLAGNAQVSGNNADYIDVDTQNPTVTAIVASDVAICDGDAGVDAFTITATFSEVMNNSIEYVPTVVFDPELDSTLTNPSGTWSDGDTVYTWTFDIEGVGADVDDVDVAIDGGRDLAGNDQAPGTNTDYIDVDNQNPTVTIAASDVAIYDGDAGVDALTITATFSEAMDNSYVPTVAFTHVLNTTLTNPSGAWSASDTVYTWTYDIEDAGVKANDVKIMVDGGRDLAGNVQVPGTNTDYIDIDTQNPTVTITGIPDTVKVLASIPGTASDTPLDDLQKVEVMIENATSNEYWDGSSWVSTERWLSATGTTSWSYDTSSVTFTDGKSYTLKARTTDKAGNISTLDSDSFTFYETPVAIFTIAPTSGNAPLTVQFTDESTGTINSYTWGFGDGQTSNEQNPLYTYDSPGTYTVILTVAGPGGTGTETKSDLITVEKRGWLGGCTCSPTEENIPINTLLIGWGVIGLCWGTGYYLVRRSGKPGK